MGSEGPWHRDTAQSAGLGGSTCTGHSKVGTAQGSEGVLALGSTSTVGTWAADSHTKHCCHSGVSPLQEDNILPSVMTIEIVAPEKV